MKLIIITSPTPVEDEITKITQLFEAGLPLLHLRKPDATEEEMEAFIQQIPAQYHGRIVLHDHHPLALRYPLHGVHLNGRNPQAPEGYKGSVSRSCHSLDEVVRYKDECSYVFLSPIFDSISKQGYHAAFTPEQLQRAADKGIIDDKVMGLGGISMEGLPVLRHYHFGGAVFMGDIWKQDDPLVHFEALMQASREL